MNSEQGRLADLHNIVLPEPVALWPPDTGGLLLLGALLICVALIALHRYLRWRRDGYRRAGMQVLDGAETVRDVSVVLKRVALAAYPRHRVASLYGAEWVDFLNRTCSRTVFEHTAFQGSVQPPPVELKDSARRWIGGHDAALPAETGEEG